MRTEKNNPKYGHFLRSMKGLPENIVVEHGVLDVILIDYGEAIPACVIHLW